MRVARIFVARKRSFEMPRSLFVFTASIKGQAERDVRGCETRIAFQCFAVSLARFTLSALLVERESGNVALLRARCIRRIRNWTRRGFEIRVVIDWRISSITQQHAAVFALERQHQRLT